MNIGNLCKSYSGILAIYGEPPIGESRHTGKTSGNPKQIGVLERNQTCVILDFHPQKCYLGHSLAKIITDHGVVCWIRSGGLEVLGD
jgi:hypothetical protein